MFPTALSNNTSITSIRNSKSATGQCSRRSPYRKKSSSARIIKRTLAASQHSEAVKGEGLHRPYSPVFQSEQTAPARRLPFYLNCSHPLAILRFARRSRRAFRLGALLGAKGQRHAQRRRIFGNGSRVR